MADITMCSDIDCPIRCTCYRFTAKPSDWQFYFTESPRSGEKCEQFLADQRRSESDICDILVKTFEEGS